MADRSVRDVPIPKLTVIDLFAGCGGLSQGFRHSGYFEPVQAVEWDPAAAATYGENFGHDHVVCGDIGDWVAKPLPSVDVVIGGPPCQGFSNLGKKREDDERNQLWRKYVDALVKIKPKAFLLENVDRFWTSREFAALESETINRRGRLADYRLDVDIVRAPDFGSAQLRRRVIVIGTLKSLPQITIPLGTTSRSQWKTVKDALAGVPQSVPVDRVELPDRRLPGGMPGAFESVELHVTRNYDPDISIPRFHAIPPGGNRFDLPEHLKAPCWRKHHSGAGDVMGRLRWEQPSVTIRTEFFKPEKGRYLHPEEHRALTHYEAAKIQGFPDDFKWCGSKTQIARQIGNAVPVELAQALAEHIGEQLTGGRAAADGNTRRRPRAEPLPLFPHAPKSGGKASQPR